MDVTNATSPAPARDGMLDQAARPMKGFFFTADDFGRDPATNRAILRAYEHGALHGASLMMGQAGTAEAVAMARDHPALQVGLHWHFCDSTPLTCHAWPWGASPAAAGWAIGLHRRHRELAWAEARAQIAAFEDTGLPRTFVNSHHHLHIHPRLGPGLWPLVGRWPEAWLRLGWVRWFGKRPDHLGAGVGARLLVAWARRNWTGLTSGGLWGLDRPFAMQPDEVLRATALDLPGRQEFLFHPRSDDDQDARCLRELRQRLSAA